MESWSNPAVRLAHSMKEECKTRVRRMTRTNVKCTSEAFSCLRKCPQIHFVEVISMLELIVCTEFDCCDFGLHRSAPAVQK